MWLRRAFVAIAAIVLLMAVWHLLTDRGTDPLCPICQSGLAMLLGVTLWFVHAVVLNLPPVPQMTPLLVPRVTRVSTRAPPSV